MWISKQPSVLLTYRVSVEIGHLFLKEGGEEGVCVVRERRRIQDSSVGTLNVRLWSEKASELFDRMQKGGGHTVCSGDQVEI